MQQRRLSPYLLRYSSIAAAAFLPAPIALITVAAPVTISPPANTPAIEVAPASSATMLPRLLTSRSGVVCLISGFGPWPIAITTMSTSSTYSLPAIATGLRRPLASASPSSILIHFRPLTQPFSSPRIATGLFSRRSSMPSSLAWPISSLRAGISSSLRRYTIYTCSAPRRFAVRAASIAHPLRPAPS